MFANILRLDLLDKPLDIITGEPEEELDIWTTDEFMVTQASHYQVLEKNLLSNIIKFKKTLKALDAMKNLSAANIYKEELKETIKSIMLAANKLMVNTTPEIKNKIVSLKEEISNVNDKLKNKSFSITDKKSPLMTKKDLEQVILALYNTTASVEDLKVGIVDPNLMKEHTMLHDFVFSTEDLKRNAPMSDLGYKDIKELQVLRQALFDTYKYMEEVDNNDIIHVEQTEINEEDNIIEQDSESIDYDKVNESFKETVKEFMSLQSTLVRTMTVRKLYTYMYSI